MLEPANDEVLNALRRLSGTTDFDTLVEWFRRSKAKLVKDSETQKDELMYRNQGARQLLSAFERSLEAANRPSR